MKMTPLHSVVLAAAVGFLVAVMPACGGGQGGCDVSSCAAGCCLNNICLSGTSSAACGSKGATCSICPASQACDATARTCKAARPNQGGGTGGGSGGGGGTTPAQDAGMTDAGAVACGPSSCASGCCTSAGCVPGTVSGACGVNGSMCAICQSGFSCNSGLCVSPVVDAGIGDAGLCLPNVVMSQVYGGGGNSGATFQTDYVELHNRSASAVNLGTWSIQFALPSSATWNVGVLGGSIQPNGYYLVAMLTGGDGGVLMPEPDFRTATAVNPSAIAGKIALVSSTTTLSGACPTGQDIVDFVGYGAATTCAEGSPAAAQADGGGLTSVEAAIRNGKGCIDTGDNAADFTRGTPAPKSSASAAQVCGVCQ